MSTIIAFLIAIAILVTVHEFGHYWVAKKVGVKVLRFSVGFGKPLWTRVAGKDQTEFVVAALPLGGYVKMLDENEGNVAADEKHRAFNQQKLHKKAAIVLAGPAFNLLFALLAYWVIYMIGVEGLRPVVGQIQEGSVAESAGFKPGETIVAVDGLPVRSWDQRRLYLLQQTLDEKKVNFTVKDNLGVTQNRVVDLSKVNLDKVTASVMGRGIGLFPQIPELPAVIGEVREGPAAVAGIVAGDRVIAVDNQPVNAWSDLVKVVRNNPGQQIRLTIVRDKEEVVLVATPDRIESESGNGPYGRLNILPQSMTLPQEYLVQHRYGPLPAFGEGARDTWMMSVLTLRLIYKMITMELSTKNISGPITIAQYAGYSAKAGIDRFLMFLAVVSISLGVLNLLPIPVLDGGHLLFYLIEAIKGKPLSDEAMRVGQQIGIVLLMGLMVLAFYNDILRLL